MKRIFLFILSNKGLLLFCGVVGSVLIFSVSVASAYLITFRLTNQTNATSRTNSVKNLPEGEDTQQEESFDHEEKTAQLSKSQTVPSITKTPQLSLTPTKKVLQPTIAQTQEVTPIPTSQPINTPVPQPTSTPVPQPTNTPTPTPKISNPPIMQISYPSEHQAIELTSSTQTFCVVDIPNGGNTSSLVRRHSINDGSWSSYTDIFTLCYEPVEGGNRLQLQYKNGDGDESVMYTRQFTFHREASP